MRVRQPWAFGNPLQGVVACALLALVASIASATSVRPMPMKEIAALSGHVCWATVQSIAPRWAEGEGRREIESVVRLVDIQYLKGYGPDAADWVIPGGTLDGFTMAVEGAPVFSAGERWMLFLLPEWRVHPCTGIWQGAFQEIITPQGQAVMGNAGMVAGLGADGHTKFGAATDRGLNAAEWSAIIAPMCAAEVGAAAAAPAQVAAPTSTLGTRMWTSHTATPMRGADGTPLNKPARQARPGAPRPEPNLAPASPRPRLGTRAAPATAPPAPPPPPPPPPPPHAHSEPTR